ncbi:DUF3276 family protein [Fibrivirga algicola]|uniref:PUR family DNA/RNA-binding protein n=1 Tax=Fibrivirga algicola TaxID=2950420 RepID=A0ABX0Q9M3_9BACT|nr:DUF3276 family protein [Fibrivirga algicola]ARK08963.1 DNA-binding protein [Fibrella sp. ES10-3-2-2]NID08855.1 PUR family DNA/RNA-binding protein [Fibrivirga algicola]
MEDRDKEKIYSKRVRAGKRTYFFDVKATRANDYYLILTESRRQPQGDSFSYEKQKMFLYKEDFAKFIEALQETIDYVKTELMPDVDFAQFNQPEELSDDLSSSLKWE